MSLTMTHMLRAALQATWGREATVESPANLAQWAQQERRVSAARQDLQACRAPQVCCAQQWHCFEILLFGLRSVLGDASLP